MRTAQAPGRCRRCGVAGFALLWGAAVEAQSLPANPPLPPVAGAAAAPAPSAPPGDADAMPPYQPQLERLAERLGTLTLLRGLCRDGDAEEFRNRMAALIEAEARAAASRARLADAFNRGFRGYGATYRSCTPSARLVISRFLAEAERLARDLASRYDGT